MQHLPEYVNVPLMRFARRIRSMLLVWQALTLLFSLQVALAQPLARAHAHNDYLHPRPLLDALAHGFWSVEADVWLTNGQLLVAHDLDKVSSERTLERLYLEPLKQFTITNAAAFARAGSFTLLIDFKSDATNTWLALREQLVRYTNMLTRFDAGGVHTNNVTIVISGNRPTGMIAADPSRYAAVDGRLPDLDATLSPALVPLVSDNWTKHFKWNGRGALPEPERERLRRIVQQAHAQGRRIRFWAVPDSEPGWRELRDAGVDLINTDKLRELEQFLRSR